MDENRFDEFSKALAAGAISRRSVLRRVAAVGLGIGAGLLRVNGAARHVLAQQQPTTPSPCTIHQDGQQRTYTLSIASTEDQLSLTYTLGLQVPQAAMPPSAGLFGPDTCLPGYVWREAVPNDHVCVTPQVRQQAANDNAAAQQRYDPNGALGPDTCLQGYVWREAVPSDHVCVTPQTRQQAADDNSHAQERRANSASAPAAASVMVQPGTVSSHLAITRLSATASPLLQIDSTASPAGAAQFTIKYGDVFQGVKTASWSSTDGQVFQGMIAGKPTTQYQSGADPSSVRFADGGPLPALMVDPGLQAAITRLLGKVQQAAAFCASAPASSAGTVTFDRGGPLAILPAPGRLVSQVRPACSTCLDECASTFYVCAAVALAGCYFTFGIGCIAAGVCDANAVNCQRDCDDPGKPCCPVFCGSSTFGHTCCPPGTVCADKSENPCCPTSQDVCKGVCCAAGQICNQDICCGRAQEVCNGVCCPSGQHCADSAQALCCPIGSGPVCGSICCVSNQHCDNGLCCAAGEVNLNGACCPQGNVCGNVCCYNGTCLDASTGNCCSGFGVKACGSSCCNPDSVCVNAGTGTCCPREQGCGSICCPSGQICNDVSTGTCGPSGCPAGQVTCNSHASVTPLTEAPPVCCAPSVYCCAGKCCAAAELCCDDGTGYHCSVNCIR